VAKRRGERPILITDAARSQDDERRSRQVRYTLMMSIRAVCLVVAAVLVGARAPMLWLWLPLCLLGMVLVPWLAVILANDRPPRDKHRLRNRLHHQPPAQTEPQALPAQRTIEADD
jgi:fatty acid desaturase